MALVPLLFLMIVCALQAQAPSQVRGDLGSGSPLIPRFADEKAAFQAAEELYASKEYEDAISSYKRFLKTYPGSNLASKAQLQLADLLLLQGRWSAAFDAYQKLISTYPNTPEFEGAVARQVLIANSFLDLSRVRVLGYAVPVPGVTGAERAQKMYEAILKNAPYSIYAPITQFNLGLAF
ncbi:MAG TPA: tetratricopeptide repeat protein, partial [Terrimicrobiaceae bacterium]|nr:tetratricopeptide repeat protein [Terrimicrobiaceae bacterium]